MAASTEVMLIGVMAEEKNDVEVLYEYTSKLVPENSFKFAHFYGHGCGKLRNKCRGWTENLIGRGCTHIIVLHDSDGKDAGEIRLEMEKAIKHSSETPSLVLVPVHEVEAWLLSDPNAVKHVFNMRKVPRLPVHPEKITDPKKYLRDLVAKMSKATYINTVHNKRIANAQTIDALAKCPSFGRYPMFIKGE